MHEECHRCGADLDPGGNAFCCSHCGSPQLHIAAAMSEDASDDTVTTGHPPPPKPAALDWKYALRSALSVALIGAVLFAVASAVPALTIVSFAWILCAAFIATSFYQRRHPLLQMDASIGARIGLSVGVVMTALLAISLAAVGLVARFRLHALSAFDTEMAARMHEQVEKAVAANPTPAELVQQMLSQEFRTGVMLTALLMLAVLIVLFSTCGGVVSGMLAAGRRNRAA